MKLRTEGIITRAREIEQLLNASPKAMTAVELHAHFPVARTTFDRAFHLLRQEKRIYVDDHCKPPSRTVGPGSWCAMYRVGNLPDKPWPTLTREEWLAQRRAQVKKRDERRKREAEKAVDGRKRQPPFVPRMDPLAAVFFGRADSTGGDADSAAI